jgi:hypothetical protein
LIDFLPWRPVAYLLDANEATLGMTASERVDYPSRMHSLQRGRQRAAAHAL